VRQQDKELWPLVNELDDKLNKLWQEKGGEDLPNRTKQ
jgi:hypothetical protein